MFIGNTQIPVLGVAQSSQAWDAPLSRQVEVSGERSAWAEGHGQAEGAFHSGIRNLSEAAS